MGDHGYRLEYLYTSDCRDLYDFSGSHHNLIYQHFYTTPPEPRSLQPSISIPLQEVILRCLEKQPENRYASCDELYDALSGAVTFHRSAPHASETTSSPVFPSSPDPAPKEKATTKPGRSTKSAQQDSYSYLDEKELLFQFGEILAESFHKDPAYVKDNQRLSQLGSPEAIEEFFSALEWKFDLPMEEREKRAIRTVADAKKWLRNVIKEVEKELTVSTDQELEHKLYKIAKERFENLPARLTDATKIRDLGDEMDVEMFFSELEMAWDSWLDEDEYNNIQTWGQLKKWLQKASHKIIQEKRKNIEDNKQFRYEVSEDSWEDRISSFQRVILKLFSFLGPLVFVSDFVVTFLPLWLANTPYKGLVPWSQSLSKEFGHLLPPLGGLLWMIFSALPSFIGGCFNFLERRRSRLLKLGYRNLFWVFLFMSILFIASLSGVLFVLLTGNWSKMVTLIRSWI